MHEILFFEYNDVFYKQKSGLTMRWSLSRILARPFLEFLEFGSFKSIIPKDSNYITQIIYYSCIYGIMTTKITERSNNIEPTTDFTYERENKT